MAWLAIYCDSYRFDDAIYRSVFAVLTRAYYVAIMQQMLGLQVTMPVLQRTLSRSGTLA